MTQSGKNGVSERDVRKTNLPFSRLINIKVLYLRGENSFKKNIFISKKGPV